MTFFAPFKKLTKKAYLVALITFFLRAGHFMSLPFLAIYLAEQGLFSPGQIGMILGIAGLLLSVTGILNGLYVDRRSQKKILISSLLLSSLCYFAFAFSMQYFYALLFINAALGWLRSLIEVSSTRILVTHTPAENLSTAYSAKFIAANLGVAFGPLIGALMATQQSLWMFYIAGGIHLVLVLVMLFYQETDTTISQEQPGSPVLKHFKDVLQDQTLRNITFINFIIWIIYSQIDTTLPQYLAYTWKQPAKLFSIIMLINAVICVLFQPFVLRLAEWISFKRSCLFGCVLFSLSFLLLSFFPTAAAMMLAVVLMTLGELFLLTVNGLIILRIAPKHLIGSYNGFSYLALLGLSVGPILGGYGLEWLGGEFVFLGCALVPLLAVWRYLQLRL